MNRLNRGPYQQPIPNQVQNQQESFSGASHESPIKNEQNIQYTAILVFVILIGAVVVFKTFTSYDQDVQNGRFYTQYLMSFELIDQWKMTQQKLAEQQSDTAKKIIQKGQHVISRQEMGRNSWSLLHMITGAFPETFDDKLRMKFNTFLVLFGQMYPCKLCANHFMQLLRKEGLFEGNTKKQLMVYLCQLHNKVNKRLGHPQHDCTNVVQQWNTCGCSGAPAS